MDDFEEKLNEILKDTDEYDKIRSELDDSYLLSGAVSDDELDAILGEFGVSPQKEQPSPIKDTLSTDELIAVKEGVPMSLYNGIESEEAAEEEEKEPQNDIGSETVVFGDAPEKSLEYGEKDEVDIVNEKVLKEKEERFFGKGSKIRENVFNWEKDKDLKTSSKEEESLYDGQLSFFTKEETEQDKKLTGYFTDVYDVSDVMENSRRLKEMAGSKEKPSESDGAVRFTGIMGKLFNEPESNEEPVKDISDEEESTVEDYDNSEYASEIANDLQFQKRQSMLRLIFAAAVTAVLLVIDLAVSFKIALPPVIDYTQSAFSFAIASLGLLAAVVACGARSFISGITGIFTLKPTNDSAPSIAVITAMITDIVLLISGAPNGSFYSFTGIAALCFTVNLLSKYLRLRTVSASFEIVSSDKQKHVAIPVSQFPQSGAFSEEIAVMKTDFVKGFMDSVTAYDGTERLNVYLVPIMLVAVIVSGVIAAMKGLSAVTSLTFALNAAVLSASLISPLSAALPIFFESSVLRKKNAAVLSLKAADSFDDKHVLVVRDTELFNPETMKIKAMKVFPENELYETILYTASLYAALGGPAACAFKKLLGDGEPLHEVSELSVRDGIGITATVGGKKLYSGIPSFINSLEVDMQGIDLDAAYKKSNGKIIAIADENRLMGVFSLSYTGGKRMKQLLRAAEEYGYTVAVCSDDPNITARFIMNCYKEDDVEIEIVGTKHASELCRATCDKTFIPAKLVSTDGPLGVFHAVISALRQRRSAKIGDMVRFIAAIVAAVVALFLAITGSLEFFGAAAVLAFQLVWLLVLAAVTFLRL
ncbi:MAG: hypothetical protein IKA51_02585 [Clostridia bacterium]|nr:hypothetical protein [Clostridia bacterium]